MSKLFALESTDMEVERVFYCYTNDFKQLDKLAKFTKIEQCEIISDYGPDRSKGGTIRARCYDDSRYELTMKKSVAVDKGFSAIESELKLNKQEYETFKLIATSRYTKLRYKIKSDQGLWDIDVLIDKDGNPLPWMKVDLESTNNTSALPEFPFKCDVWFENTKGVLTAKQSYLKDYIFNMVIVYNPKGMTTLLTERKFKPMDINNLAGIMGK